MHTVYNIKDLSNKLLIALPTLEHSIFDRSVALICRHDKYGAMGLMFNKISAYTLGDILLSLNIHPKSKTFLNEPVFEGGPMHHNYGFVIHSPIGHWKNTIKVNQHIGITSSKDILEAIANDVPPDNFLIILGYASWDEGQLEQELIHNAWLTAPIDNELLFDKQFNTKWQKSTNKIGVNLFKISQTVGHA